jgi:hypothetical protein
MEKTGDYEGKIQVLRNRANSLRVIKREDKADQIDHGIDTDPKKRKFKELYKAVLRQLNKDKQPESLEVYPEELYRRVKRRRVSIPFTTREGQIRLLGARLDYHILKRVPFCDPKKAKKPIFFTKA